MSSKRLILFLIVIIIIIYLKNFVIVSSICFQILALTFLFTLRYIHNKFVLFCNDKMKNEKNLNGINIYSNSPFLEACKRGDTKLVEQLVNLGVNIYETNKNGDGAIHNAVYYSIFNPEKRSVDCLWLLHKFGCPMNLKNHKGFTPLHIAAMHGHVSLIKWLVRKGADVNMKPEPFGVALDAGHTQAAALLLALKFNLTTVDGKGEENKYKYIKNKNI